MATWKKLAYEGDTVLKSLFNANTILAANTDDTPAALEVAVQTLVGRITAGNITDLSTTEVRTLINVADGSDVTGDNAPQAHAPSHKNAGSDEILLNELGEPTAAVDFNGQEAENLIIQQVANEAAVTAYATPVVGKVLFATAELTMHVCTVV